MDQDPELLRMAGSDYPDDPLFDAQYLQLPPGLSPSLMQYVEEATEGAETPYDRAVALEAALREIPYSLEVPPPPPDAEVVSWFLYDLQRGYCDYYATAMVVLARLAGIPARLAVGYTTGNYEPDNDQYVITELSAHSWPELYFPYFGWVAFEPTAGRDTPTRIAAGGGLPPWMRVPGAMDIGSGLLSLQQVAEEERRYGQLAIIARWSVLALLAAAMAWTLRIRARALAQAPLPDALDGLFDRLLRYGDRLGSPARRGDTPREYVTSLRAAADQVANQAAVFRGGAELAASTVHREAERLRQAYEKATYAPETTESLVTRFEEAHDWSALWSALRRLSISRWRMRGHLDAD
jgi:hypothetical protein